MEAACTYIAGVDFIFVGYVLKSGSIIPASSGADSYLNYNYIGGRDKSEFSQCSEKLC